MGLYVAFQYKIAETSARGDRWEIQIAGYRFALWNASVSEIISYHWHPVGVSAVTTPHLHLGPGALVGRDELKAAHLPTGAIALAGVIRLAIADLGVVPRRSDWAEVLQ
ncbi:MAG: hypothetical protein HY681_13870 [Chloroflexi bacterium]|nr:hypothetical protein [Chloroflexota bacterium]